MSCPPQKQQGFRIFIIVFRILCSPERESVPMKSSDLSLKESRASSDRLALLMLLYMTPTVGGISAQIYQVGNVTFICEHAQVGNVTFICEHACSI